MTLKYLQDVDSARAELTMKKVKDDILRDTGVSIVIEVRMYVSLCMHPDWMGGSEFQSFLTVRYTEC